MDDPASGIGRPVDLPGGEAPTPQWQKLNQDMEQVASACKPTERDRQARLELINRITTAVRNSSVLVNPRVEPYGSFVSGFYNSSSDLDLAVAGHVLWTSMEHSSQREYLKGGKQVPEHVEVCKLDKKGKQAVLRRCINKVMDHHITDRSSVQYILHARVPIIKFRDRATGIECDLSIGGDGQDLKAQTFALLTRVNPCFQSLFAVVKMWAKAHGINDGTAGMFNSHCLALLVILYLQQRSPPALPPMYRLFYSERPPYTHERILQGSNPASFAGSALAHASARVVGASQEFNGTGGDLADMLLGFVTSMAAMFERILLNPDNHVRLSCWWGEVVEQCTASEYVLVVEEPMHNEDNPARTFGKKHEFPWTLHYVIDVMGRTQRALKAIQAGQHPPLAALLFLFGPGAVVTAPVNQAMESAVGPEWSDWVRQNLKPDRSNAGPVLMQALEHLGVHAIKWLPDHAVQGASNYREFAMAEGKARAKELRAEAEAARKKLGIEPAVPEMVPESLDEAAAARSAAQMVGYPAALQVATEVAVRRYARDLAKKQEKEQEQARKQARAREAALGAKAAASAAAAAGTAAPVASSAAAAGAATAALAGGAAVAGPAEGKARQPRPARQARGTAAHVEAAKAARTAGHAAVATVAATALGVNRPSAFDGIEGSRLLGLTLQGVEQQQQEGANHQVQEEQSAEQHWPTLAPAGASKPAAAGTGAADAGQALRQAKAKQHEKEAAAGQPLQAQARAQQPQQQQEQPVPGSAAAESQVAEQAAQQAASQAACQAMLASAAAGLNNKEALDAAGAAALAVMAAQPNHPDQRHHQRMLYHQMLYQQLPDQERDWLQLQEEQELQKQMEQHAVSAATQPHQPHQQQEQRQRAAAGADPDAQADVEAEMHWPTLGGPAVVPAPQLTGIVSRAKQRQKQRKQRDQSGGSQQSQGGVGGGDGDGIRPGSGGEGGSHGDSSASSSRPSHSESGVFMGPTLQRAQAAALTAALNAAQGQTTRGHGRLLSNDHAHAPGVDQPETFVGVQHAGQPGYPQRTHHPQQHQPHQLQYQQQQLHQQQYHQQGMAEGVGNSAMPGHGAVGATGVHTGLGMHAGAGVHPATSMHAHPSMHVPHQAPKHAPLIMGHHPNIHPAHAPHTRAPMPIRGGSGPLSHAYSSGHGPSGYEGLTGAYRTCSDPSQAGQQQ